MAAGARRQHAVEHVDAARDRLDHVVGLAHAHQVARPVGGQRRHVVAIIVEHHLLRLADRQAADGVAVEADRDERLGRLDAQPAWSPPCTMPNSALPRLRAERGLRPLRPAQRQLASPARSPPLGAGSATHSSSCMRMSESSRSWISIERSGVSRWAEPSRCDWKATPSSSILRSAASDMTWKPPESVRIGPGQWRSVQAAERRDPLGAGPQHQVIGVAEDDVGAERRAPGRGHRLDRAGGADRHEGGRADVPRGSDRRCAAPSRVDGEARSWTPMSSGGQASVPTRQSWPNAWHASLATCMRIMALPDEQAGVAVGVEAVAVRDGVGVGRAWSRGRRRPRPA